jgi:putative aldouronate transport system permease protein
MVNTGGKMNKPSLADYLILIFLILLGIATLYPFLNIFFISISNMEEVVRSNGLMLWPKSINWEGYSYVLRYGGLVDAFKVTVYITVVGTAINLVMTSLGAYVLSCKEMPGRNFFMSLVLVTMFFGGGLIPNYLVIKNLGLLDSLWALMLPGAISTWNLILLRNFFQSIPSSLKESARIDGASELTILVKLMLPLSIPIIATLALFYGVGHWNEYMGAIIYINKAKLNPLQVIIRSMYNIAIEQLDGDSLPPPVETVRCATVMLATLPIICVYPFLQKYFVQGMLVGSIKG